MLLLVIILFFIAASFGTGGISLLVTGITTSDSGMAGSSIILIVVAAAAIVGLAVLFIRQIIRIKTIRRILKHGEYGIGTSLGKWPCLVLSQELLYKLRFEFTADGKKNKVKSLRTYTAIEIAALQRLRRFNIKHHNGKAVIDEDIRLLVRENSRAVREGQLNKDAPLPPIVRCLYCNSKVKPNASNCRNCGAEVVN